MARCSKCASTTKEDLLFTWFFKEDEKTAPCKPELLCRECPQPRKCMQVPFNAKKHNEILGINYSGTALAYATNTKGTLMGLCFECNEKFNMTEGYGDVTLHKRYWRGHNRYTSIAYCQPCYRIKREEAQKLENKLSDYWSSTIDGQLPFL